MPSQAARYDAAARVDWPEQAFSAAQESRVVVRFKWLAVAAMALCMLWFLSGGAAGIVSREPDGESDASSAVEGARLRAKKLSATPRRATAAGPAAFALASARPFWLLLFFRDPSIAFAPTAARCGRCCCRIRRDGRDGRSEAAKQTASVAAAVRWHVVRARSVSLHRWCWHHCLKRQCGD